MKTCVLCFSRRKAFEWTIRSLSRWNGVLRRHSPSSSYARPRVSYERTASGDSQLSCSRTRASNSSATRPARSGIFSPTLDDDGDGSAVNAPGGSCDEVGAVRAQKRDHRRDFLRLGKAPQRAALSDIREHLLTALPAPLRRLVSETAVREPRLRGRRPRSHGVAENPLPGVNVRDQPRKRKHRGLRDAVVGHPRRRPLPGSRADVDDAAETTLPHAGQHRLDRADVAHDVQLPELFPVFIGQLVEGADLGEADVVDEDLHRPHLPLGFADELARRFRLCQIARNVERLPHAGPRFTPPGGDDAGALLRQEGGRLPSYPIKGALDNAHAIFEADVDDRL